MLFPGLANQREAKAESLLVYENHHSYATGKNMLIGDSD
jgi:hypothetical protein